MKLERYLPYDIRAGTNIVRFHARPVTVVDSGIEGLVRRCCCALRLPVGRQVLSSMTGRTSLCADLLLQVELVRGSSP